MKNSQTLSSKPVSVSHEGDGLIKFQIPHFSESILIHPEAAKKTRPLNQKDIPFRARIYLLLLEVSNLLKGKNNAFYLDLLQEGFLRKGAITLIGLVGSEDRMAGKKLFKTVIQLDGDIICQIDRNLLSGSDINVQMTAYNAVQDQILKEFKQTFCSIVGGFLLIFSNLLAILFFLIRMVFP